MPGAQKKSRLLAELRRRAQCDIGDGASELEYLEQYLASGGLFSALAQDLTRTLKQSVSRPFLSFTAHNLGDDAKLRLERARREGAGALVEETLSIADNAPETTGAVGKAKLQVGTRQWLAEKYNPEEFGQRKQVAVSWGELHLAALRQRAHTQQEQRHAPLQEASVTTDALVNKVEIAPAAGTAAEQRPKPTVQIGSGTDER